jgi:hypothetical protein
MSLTLQQERYYVLPVGGPPIRYFQPALLADANWSRFSGDVPSLPGIPFSNPLARQLAHYCLSPGGIEFDPEDGHGLAELIHPLASSVYERVRSSALRLPRSSEELVRFRTAIGLSDLPVRIGPCWAGGGSIHDSPWVYPPADTVPGLMEDWFAFMWSSRHAWSLRFAIGIPQFLRIHPFAGANGKTVRAFLIKHGQTTGQMDPVALALALMIQGRRSSLLALRDDLYLGRIAEYVEQILRLAGWISDTCLKEQGAWSGGQITADLQNSHANSFLDRFFTFSDAIYSRGHEQC